MYESPTMESLGANELSEVDGGAFVAGPVAVVAAAVAVAVVAVVV